MTFQQYPSKGGIPSGNTAGRPSSPIIGDTYYNGELGLLEIYTSAGWQPASAPPASPTSVVATASTTSGAYTTAAVGSVSVAFNTGIGGGLPTSYFAYTTTGGFSGTASASPITISGLSIGTEYVVYAIAQNGYGNSPQSANAAGVSPSSLPQIRTIGTATASTTTSEVTVTWTNGSNGGLPLSAITITPYLNGTTAQTSRTAATTTSTSYTFTSGQLDGAANYTFKVSATNANGTCAESTATNSVKVYKSFSVSYLLVGAGAGGGAPHGTGGGAGGVLTGTVTVNTLGTYALSIGSGGAGAVDKTTTGGYGDDTTGFSLTAGGGGGGGKGYDVLGNPNANGAAGRATNGSGGGGGNGGGVGGAGNGAGYAGGTGISNPGAGGGGGGAGGTGGNASGSGAGTGPTDRSTGSLGGLGGAGITNSLTGSSVSYAGGGGGGGWNNAGGPATHGGGRGGNSGEAVAPAGTANTGGGGGGAADGGSDAGNGGSGIIVLRWATADAPDITIGAGLTADATGTDGSYKYKRITAGSGNVSF